MIIESVREYFVNPDDAADFYPIEYQEFVAFSDNEDTTDFLIYLVERFGSEQIISDLNLVVEGAIDRIL
jgi:hypothetical protein